MEKLFYKLGRKFGSSLIKGKWYYKSVFGSDEDAIQAEYLVGGQLARDVLKQMPLTKNPAKQDLVKKIGFQLCQKLTNKQRKYQFLVVSGSEVNAFALPGGFIFITDSLLDQEELKEDEIAFVLAHEILHVILKHPFNRVLAEFSSQFIANVVVKGGALGALAKKALTDLLSKSYSRDKEFEADRYAVRLSYSAGFNPHGAKQLLARLKGFSPEDIPVYNYFLSHPAIDERINRINLLIKARKMVSTMNNE